eukprot:scaffold4019_cov143-Amphora_coffeaeformis.AAC.2
MTLSNPKRGGRALDGDPTLGSFSPSAVVNGQLEWPASPKTWDEDEEEASFERPPYQARKLEPFLIPDDQDDVSSIDRPLETSAWTPTMLSSLHFEDEQDEGDLPPLNTNNGSKEVTEKDNTLLVENKEKQKTFHQATEEREKKNSFASSPSPLSYKQKANPQHRRVLAKKILQYRKKVSANLNKVENDSSGSSGDSPSTPSKSSLKSPKYGRTETGVPTLNLNTENDAATKSPESSDETVSWASTLTTDPSRLVTPSTFMPRRGGHDDGSRQVPYLRMDTLPSVDESEEPTGKLDRHFFQQQSTPSHSTKQKSPSMPLVGQSEKFTPEEPPSQPGTLPSQPSSNETQPEFDSTLRSAQPSNSENQPEVDFALRSTQAYLDQRDDQTHSVRRTFSGSQSEVSERYRRSAPDRSAIAQSDPGDGTSVLSPLAQAAAHWPQLSDQRVVPLINYGNTNDVLVTLHPGGETFEHSSHILAYASPVLRRKLQPVLGGWYRLELQQTTMVEWQLITPFLEPHSVQSAVVTPSNLSHLLPWFLQLHLDILLTECDQLLVTLEFPKAHPSEGTAVSAADKSVSSGSAPQVKDMVDIILLTEIGCLGQLVGVREASLETLESYLALHPGLAVDSEVMPLLMRLLKDYPPARQRLWRRSLVRFLPSDLPIFNEKKRSGEAELVVVETMVYNPLFPFLLREGLSKAAKEDEYERRAMDLEERWKRFRDRQHRVQQTSQNYRAAMGRENSILEDTRGFMDESTEESSTTGSLSLSRSESVNTSKLQQAGLKGTSLPLAVVSAMCDDGSPNSFANWWLQGSKKAIYTKEISQPKTSLQQSLASIRSRAESQRLKQEIDDITRSARSRTHWLELILKRLNRPPIFQTVEGEPEELAIPKAGKRDPRTFLC